VSKKCMKRRESRREDLESKNRVKRDGLRVVIRDPNATLEQKEQAQKQIQTMPRDAAKARMRKRCWKTGRGNGVYPFSGLCRHMLRLHAMQGDLPGIRKSSW
jgi:small subunit ribosomal protein S14